ncbi:hypothetical protein [Nocardia otitidiscaviarum]|uniref:hypothetical protein n=1 Tax=Nocardia otitidiscaviarum TaxID=1823 RepID=UPI001E2B71BB|nr:hypothetical protein [Nocardia otitidiscaviarum]
MAITVTVGSATRTAGSAQPASFSWAPVTKAVSTATSTMAGRTGRMRRPVYSSGTAHQAKLGANSTSVIQSATTTASQAIPPRHAPMAYTPASTIDSPSSTGVRAASGCRTRKRASAAATSSRKAAYMRRPSARSPLVSPRADSITSTEPILPARRRDSGQPIG